MLLLLLGPQNEIRKLSIARSRYKSALLLAYYQGLKKLNKGARRTDSIRSQALHISVSPRNRKANREPNQGK